MRKTLTGGGVVIGPDNKVLVVNQHGRTWSLPKGHIEPGEDSLQAAMREIKEESGVSQLVHIKKLGVYERHRIGLDPSTDDTTELKEISIHLFTTGQTDLLPEDPENPEARWVRPEEVSQLLTHPKDGAFYESVLPEITAFIAQKR